VRQPDECWGWVFSVRRTLIILRLSVAAIVWIAFKRPDRDAGPDSSKASAGKIPDRAVTSAEPARLTARAEPPGRDAITRAA
jgi:hypothetical protein